MSAVTLDGHEQFEEAVLALDTASSARPISIRRAVGRLTNLESLAALWRKLTYRRSLTQAEKEELRAKQEAAKARARLDAELLQECHRCERLIAHTLADLNIAYFYKKSEKDGFSGPVKRVSFLPPAYSPDVLMLRVNLAPSDRPRGVSVTDLAAPDVLSNLSVNVGRKVTATFDHQEGFVYWVWRNQAASSVPSHVRYDEMIAQRPASAGQLAIPVGMGSGGRVIWRPLDDMPHLLVAGSTGGGKSNFLRQMIATLLVKNSPAQMQIAVIDMKGGVEFDEFSDLPHIAHYQADDGQVRRAIAERRGDVVELLRWVSGEIDRRYSAIKSAHVNNIGKYNVRGGRLPYLILLIDEWASIIADREAASVGNDLLSDAANRARAAGVHIVLCTQLPNRKTLDTRVTTQFKARLVFSVPDPWVSQTLINGQEAAALSNHPGRAFWSFGRDREEVQISLITDTKLAEVVAAAKAGLGYVAHTKEQHDVSDGEVMEWAVRENDGNLGWRDIYKRFRGRGLSQKEAQQMPRRLCGQVVMIGSTQYMIHSPAGHRSAYRLLPLEAGDQPATPPERAPEGTAQEPQYDLLPTEPPA